MQKHQFINFISNLQIIGIILVVLGHSFHEYPDEAYGYEFIITRMIYSFHMPLFLFIGGYLLLYTNEISNKRRSVSSYILQRIKRLLIPFIVLTVVTFIPRSLLSNFADDSIHLSFRNFVLSFIDSDYMVIPYFWFIHVSFILSVLTFIVLQFFKRLRVNPAVALISLFIVLLIYALSSYPSTSLLSLSRLKKLAFFFILGCIYAFYEVNVDKWIRWSNLWVLFLFFSVWVISFFLFEKNQGMYFCSLMGICTCISLSKLMERKNIKIFNHLKGANFLIFLLSWYFNVFFQQFLAKFITLPWYCYTVLSLFFGIYIPWLGYKYLEKHQHKRVIRHISTILGQKFK